VEFFAKAKDDRESILLKRAKEVGDADRFKEYTVLLLVT